MKKGIVMDIDAHYITLLTREGEFLKTINQKKPYKIGEEIDFFQSLEISNQKVALFKSNKWRILVSASLVALLIFFSFLPYYLDNRVYAYMSFDVNPSLEIGVNHDLKVVSMEALNDDGKKIVSQLNEWSKKKIEDVANAIIVECKQEGYLNEGQKVLIATVMTKDNQKTKEVLQQKIEKLSTNYHENNIEIETVSAKKEERKKAKEQGISTGQLLKIENKVNHKKDKEQNNTVNHKTEYNGVQNNKNKENDNKDIKQNNNKQSNHSESKDQKRIKSDNQKKRYMNKNHEHHERVRKDDHEKYDRREIKKDHSTNHRKRFNNRNNDKDNKRHHNNYRSNTDHTEHFYMINY